MNAKTEWTLIAMLAAVAGGTISRMGRPKYTVPSGAGILERLNAESSASSTPLPPVPTLAARSLSDGLPSAGHWRGKPVLADLDGDGAVDLAASIRRWDRKTPGEGLYVWLGDGSGGWTESTEGLRRDMGYGGADVGDVDGDGKLDLAFSGHDVTPHVFLGAQDRVWIPLSSGIDVEVICSDVALGDLDGDGHDDLAVLGFYPKNGGLIVYRGGGDGGFERLASLLDPVHYGAELHVADIDGDGDMELAAVTDTGAHVWHYDPDAPGFFREQSEGIEAPEIGGSELAVVTHDFDGDGYEELFVAGMTYEGHPALRIHRWDGAAWREWGSGLPDDEAYFDAVIATLDAGRAPFVVAAGRLGLNVFAMVAPGEFARIGRVADTEGVVNVAAGDVDGDGTDEIVTVGFGGVRVLAIDLGRRAER